jgi:cytochrome c oxidase subunit 2
MTSLLMAQDGGFWMPEQASGFAKDVDFIFSYIFWVSAFFFVLVSGLMFYFVIRYRQRVPGEDATCKATHNTPLELVWTIIPTFFLVFMFWWGFQGFVDMRTVPPNTYDIDVTASQWSWEFHYVNGITDGELHCWLNKPVKLVMKSTDVLHSFFVPAFRAKRDVVPGRYVYVWFEPTKVGTFPLYCAEYCGTNHSDMTTVAVVHESEEAFQLWLSTADPLSGLPDELIAEFEADPEAFFTKYQDDPEHTDLVAKLKQMGENPVEVGQRLYAKKGCNQCHSTDGVAGNGPTWKGLWGSERVFGDGSKRLADENYVRDSIADPGKQVVAGFENVMPKKAIKESEIRMIIAYIKSLSDN